MIHQLWESFFLFFFCFSNYDPPIARDTYFYSLKFLSIFRNEMTILTPSTSEGGGGGGHVFPFGGS